MGIILKRKKHYLTRLPLWLAIMVFVAFSPVLIGFGGAWLSELLTGRPCNGNNCFWMILPWSVVISMPIGGLGFLILGIIFVVDSIQLFAQKKDPTKKI